MEDGGNCVEEENKLWRWVCNSNHTCTLKMSALFTSLLMVKAYRADDDGTKR
jgi:hypothetical protein